MAGQAMRQQTDWQCRHEAWTLQMQWQMCLKRTRHFLKLLYNTKKQIHKSEEKKNEE